MHANVDVQTPPPPPVFLTLEMSHEEAQHLVSVALSAVDWGDGIGGALMNTLYDALTENGIVAADDATYGEFG